MTNHLILLSLSQILTFFWASASWTLHPKPSLIENQSLQKKVSSLLPYDLSGLKLSCSEGDGVANVLTLVHSSLCVAMLLDEDSQPLNPRFLTRSYVFLDHFTRVVTE